MARKVSTGRGGDNWPANPEWRRNTLMLAISALDDAIIAHENNSEGADDLAGGQRYERKAESARNAQQRIKRLLRHERKQA